MTFLYSIDLLVYLITYLFIIYLFIYFLIYSFTYFLLYLLIYLLITYNLTYVFTYSPTCSPTSTHSSTYSHTHSFPHIHPFINLLSLGGNQYWGYRLVALARSAPGVGWMCDSSGYATGKYVHTYVLFVHFGRTLCTCMISGAILISD